MSQGGFSGINVVTLPAGTVNSLQGADFANSWAITTLNAGTLTENGNVLTFSGANNLTGGTNTDSFTLSGTAA